MKLPEKLRVSAQILRNMAQREFDIERYDCLVWSAFQLEKQAKDEARKRLKKGEGK